MNPAFFDGTVVAEDVRKQLAAAPRTAAAEAVTDVRGVKGSTRLEAKRQRRRDRKSVV